MTQPPAAVLTAALPPAACGVHVSDTAAAEAVYAEFASRPKP